MLQATLALPEVSRAAWGGGRSSDLQAAAREAFAQSLAQGVRLTGAQLGAQFGRSYRWGSERIAEVDTCR